MTSRTQTASKSHRYTIPKGSWTCCKCLTPNSGIHHVCDGIVPYQGIYDEICSHWHCSSCARLSEDSNFAKQNHTSSSPQPSYPFSSHPYPPPRSAIPSDPYSYYPHAQHSSPTNPYSSPYHHHQPHFPPRSSSTFSYTKAYLQSAAAAARRAHPHTTTTFAEAFPAPTKLDTSLDAEQRDHMAWAGLKLDYSAIGKKERKKGSKTKGKERENGARKRGRESESEDVGHGRRVRGREDDVGRDVEKNGNGVIGKSERNFSGYRAMRFGECDNLGSSDVRVNGYSAGYFPAFVEDADEGYEGDNGMDELW
ncbi:uncharacterized protein CTHT_0065910 [Thermochaetoides thermophila DSM 1495]|uniref:Uncharacterized protein n=1 Tax=Chaetomium thermophilum (strain DSM 1495 / CBS 144.50 / IMI 039719) TaxID=759272 RepID=G0SGD3_CHATD|nr:hypothetical protein CTHT_0065910 [Thermochaetoides thermophila DSM 1495]EGS17272.1 hypothetical protein CTHT_0065910 [Thermochaetoides thermophila DSM 1495]